MLKAVKAQVTDQHGIAVHLWETQLKAAKPARQKVQWVKHGVYKKWYIYIYT